MHASCNLKNAMLSIPDRAKGSQPNTGRLNGLLQVEGDGLGSIFNDAFGPDGGVTD